MPVDGSFVTVLPHDSFRRHARVSWTARDVSDLCGEPLDRCEAWLEKHATDLASNIVRSGWDILEEMLVTDGMMNYADDDTDDDNTEEEQIFYDGFLGVSKPSQALRAMLEGLLAADRSDGLEVVDMSDYGSKSNGVCFGCAAHWALTQLSKISLLQVCGNDYGKWLRAIASQHGEPEFKVEQFLYILNDVRLGNMDRLYKFLGVDDRMIPTRLKSLVSSPRPFYMQEHNWRDELPKMEKFIQQLEEASL